MGLATFQNQHWRLSKSASLICHRLQKWWNLKDNHLNFCVKFISFYTGRKTDQQNQVHFSQSTLKSGTVCDIWMGSSVGMMAIASGWQIPSLRVVLWNCTAKKRMLMILWRIRYGMYYLTISLVGFLVNSGLQGRALSWLACQLVHADASTSSSHNITMKMRFAATYP